MKPFNKETKTFKLFQALNNGERVSAASARKRWGIQNIRAEASRIRQHGFAVYANQKTAGNGVTVIVGSTRLEFRESDTYNILVLKKLKLASYAIALYSG